MLSKFFDFNHPVYRPLWVRVLIVGLCAAWAVFEFLLGTPFWSVIFAGAAAISFWGLFLAYDPPAQDNREDPK